MTDHPVPTLNVRGRDIAVGRPLLMGVVNATSNSFSDAGLYPDLASRLALAEQLVADGADILDIGGQSAITTVGESVVADEIEAVVPIIEHLRRTFPELPLSVDTYKPAVARAVLDAGADIVNDTSGLRDPELATVTAEFDAGLVLMHNRGRPKQRLTDADLYTDVVADVVSFLTELLATAEARGVRRDAIILDPGPDFSKTPAQTVTVLRQIDELRAFGRPLLLPVSRKDFIGAITGRPPRERLAGTLATIAHVGPASGTIYRVHDVAEVRDFLRIADVLAGREQIPADLELPPHLRRVSATPAAG